ncbi:MAG: aspartate aminotransferase family protein [Thioalkalivibrionaceae bacterium]
MTPHPALQTTYNRLDVGFVRGEGAWLEDEQGRRYLDALSGIAVCGLGHAHPEIARALCEQAHTLIHTSNIYRVPLQERLAERLCEISGMERVFFANSGAEANEAAIKLARLHARRKSIQHPKIIVMEGSFHGRTLATLSATGNTKVRDGFEPLVEGFVRVPYGDADAVAALTHDPDIVAVLAEPIIGEGGIRIPPPGFGQRLRKLCDEHDWLMMCDEIQAGIGRTGRWFAYQHQGFIPDVLSIAKGLGNGVPIGASLVAGRAADLFTPGKHGTTFGGNPLVCRVGLSVIDIMERDQLLSRAEALGARIAQGLRQRIGGLPIVQEIRQIGLMLGVELDRPCPSLVATALDEGLLLNVTAEKVIRLLPPLILSDEEADRIATGVSVCVERFFSEISAESQANLKERHA